MTSIWWNPFTTERIILKSARSPEECAAIIRSNIYRFWTMADDSAPFTGYVWKARFTLMKHTPRFWNAARPVAYAKALPDSGGGALITIRLALPRFTRVFLGIPLAIFAILFLISILGAANILSLDPMLSNPLLMLIIGLIPAAVYYAWYLFGAWLSRGERAFLIATLQRLLDATVQE